MRHEYRLCNGNRGKKCRLPFVFEKTHYIVVEMVCEIQYAVGVFMGLLIF